MKDDKIIDSNKLVNRLYWYSIFNFFLIVYVFISGIPMLVILSLVVCVYIFNKINKNKNLFLFPNKKIKFAEVISGIILITILIMFMFNIFNYKSSSWKDNPDRYNNFGSDILWFADYSAKGEPTLTEYFNIDMTKKKIIKTTVQKTGVYELNGKTYFAVITNYKENDKIYTFYLPSFTYDPSFEWEEGSSLDVIVEDGDYSKYEIPIY
jgi:hypothetical protein